MHHRGCLQLVACLPQSCDHGDRPESPAGQHQPSFSAQGAPQGPARQWHCGIAVAAEQRRPAAIFDQHKNPILLCSTPSDRLQIEEATAWTSPCSPAKLASPRGPCWCACSMAMVSAAATLHAPLSRMRQGCWQAARALRRPPLHLTSASPLGPHPQVRTLSRTTTTPSTSRTRPAPTA